ncbi:(S)-2-haloacid dehalogenase [bacterium HR33]|nr:(S)-2-haloacid dehalogenase [bacterium HR33]
MTRAFEVITFDCYGTLIDWERGIVEAFRAAAPAGTELPSPEEIIRVYSEIEPAVEAELFRKYREVLREVARRALARFGWRLGEERLGFLAESLPRWSPFPDTNPALERLKAMGYTLGILSNVDDDLLRLTLRHFTVEFDFWITAEQVGSHKPAEGHFSKAAAVVAGRPWLHVAQSHFHDVEPAVRLGIPVVWVNRKKEEARALRPTAEVDDLSGLVEWLAR